MLKALYVFAALTGWGPVFDLSALSVGVATYENQYYQILRLRSESQALPETERAEKARAVWDKVVQNYSSLEYLSFREETSEFWCTEGDWRSYLPMEYWPKRLVATSTAAMTPENVHVEISVGSQRVYSLFLADVKYSEYRWPTKELAGEYTEYPYDGMCWRLIRGVDGHLICMTKQFGRPWIGDKSKTSWYKHLQASALEASRLEMRSELQYEAWIAVFGEALWIGTVSTGGVPCDVLLLERNDSDRWDVFLVNPRGFVVARFIIHSAPDIPRDKMVTTISCRDFSINALPSTEFVPSEALTREAQGWRKLTEPEALAERDQDLAEP